MSKALEGTNFATAYTKRPRFYTDPGSTKANDYEIQIDKKGHKSLKLIGTHDIYQDIQSYKEECMIENILARAAAGDTLALNARQGFYADISNTPANLAEAQNSILKLKKEFEALPADIREKFDNSPEKFINDFGTEKWAESMGYKKTEKAKEVEFIPGTKEAAENIVTPEGN